MKKKIVILLVALAMPMMGWAQVYKSCTRVTVGVSVIFYAEMQVDVCTTCVGTGQCKVTVKVANNL